jgi:Tfp pilus assembly protein PilN
VQAWLAGGGAILGYTELFFREKLRIPVDYFQPFRRLGLPSSVEAQGVARNFSVWGAAVGTALQALPEMPVRINVLGAIARAQAQKSRNLPAMAVAAVAGTGLLLLPGIHGFWQAAKTGDQLAGQTALVEQASLALQRLESENKQFLAAIQQAELASRLEQERWRWPHLLGELKRHSPQRLWVTSLQVLPAPESPEPATVGGKPGEAPAPVVEIGGMFETQSEKADAEAVANFQKALEMGGVLRDVEVLEREAPQYVDGKTDQVALKFRLRASWPLGPASPASPRGAGG